MCGRFGATFQYREIKVRWNLYGDLASFAPRYNIAPSQDVPVIVRNESRNELRQCAGVWSVGKHKIESGVVDQLDGLHAVACLRDFITLFAQKNS
jgi:putative SOS response-associated peptidase YedK